MRSESFPNITGDLSARVVLGGSDLEVSTWNDSTTEVEVASRRDDPATLETIDAFRIELRDRGSGHELFVEEPRTRGLVGRLRDPQIVVRIRCPHGTSVDVTGGSTDVRAQGVLGALEVKTGSGDIEVRGDVAAVRVSTANGDVSLDDVSGAATVGTASGDVRLGAVAGPLSVDVVSGDVSVAEARSGASVQSVSGDVRLDAVGGGNIRVQTVSGDARVGVTAGTSVWIDASAVSGDVTSDLDVGDAPADGSDQTAFELRARSVSGDLHLTRARGVAV